MEGRYQPLRQKRSFRLLTLLPGQGDDQIVCNLRILQLPPEDSKQNAAQYEALSYVWGPAVVRHEISLDGWPVAVRENLWDFLIQARHPTEARTLWIDALCVDQANLQERSAQVQMMGSIYRAAQRVLIWLGSEDAASIAAMDLILNYVSTRDMTLLDKIGMSDVFMAWATRAYWTRTWVVQEFLLARDLCLMCGSSQLEWQAARRFCLDLEISTMYANRRIQSSWAETLQAPACSLMLQRVKANVADSTLLDLLVRNRSTQCLDARDKVYAMLSLASDCISSRTIQVDYARDSRLVVFDVLNFCNIQARDMLRYGQFLAELLGVDITGKKALVGVLEPLRTPHITSQAMRIYQASAFRTGEIIFAERICGDLAAARNISAGCKSHALSDLSEDDISRMMIQLEGLDMTQLDIDPKLLNTIIARSWSRPRHVSFHGSSSQDRNLVVVFTSHCKKKEFLIGVGSSDVKKGDSVINCPGFEIAFTTKDDALGSDCPHITGQVVCARRSAPARDALTHRSLYFQTLQSEGECSDSKDALTFHLMPNELLMLLR